VRRYSYVGPADLLAAAPPGGAGHRVGSVDDLAAWLGSREADERAEPFTFVVDLDGTLRLAPRRSEHVACAGGAPVLSAGEMAFSRDGDRWTVSEVSNHSTGYCPDPASWPAVGAALDAAGLPHPGRFTGPVVFRHCPRCGERNLVKEHDYVCALCGADLPRTPDAT
jgi:DNA-directed RNA polymerase subunit RPC12/RpoP